MKWLAPVGFLLLLIWNIEGGAICGRSDQDTSCITEKQDKEPPREVASQSELSPSGPSTECLAGTEWESNCHYCKCSDTGVAECLKQSSCDLDVFAEPIRCKPNTTFQRDCSTCVCLENGLGLCTLDACRKSTVPKKSDLKAGQECAPGTFWKSQCNDCGCSPDGFHFCTEKACINQEQEPVMRCEPDTMWRQDCNTCWCTTSGLPLCTKVGCGTVPVEQTDKKVIPEPDDSRKYRKINFNPFDEKDFEDYDEALTEIEARHNKVKRSVCKPNQVFQSDCNTCHCSTDGQHYSCTQNECMEKDVDKEVEVFKENEGVDHIERHSVCKPAGTFYIGCNTCHCNYKGTDFSCTNRPCPLPEDVELFHELRAIKSTINTTKAVVCVAYKMFIKDCNTCVCNEDGTGYFCTRKVCVPELPDEASIDDKPEELHTLLRDCRPDEVFELDCNMCRCNSDGKSYSCTRRVCVDRFDEDEKNSTLVSRQKRASVQEMPKTCKPGQEFQMDCNTCLCDNEGQDFSCTRIDCVALNNNQNKGSRKKREVTQRAQKCEPSSVFHDDCNLCQCSTDGASASCTNNPCPKPTTPAPESDPGFRCNPGEQFKRECNDCTCSADGKNVFCTLRLCDASIIQT